LGDLFKGKKFIARTQEDMEGVPPLAGGPSAFTGLGLQETFGEIIKSPALINRDKEMDIGQRDEEIWRLRREGVPLSQIAARFHISSTRAQQIYSQRQDRVDNFDKWPLLKRILSARVQNVLIKAFGSEEILDSPEKLVSMGSEIFYKWRNMGRKSVNQLMDALESLGFSVSQKEIMTDPKCRIFL
jgi:hypothetical protein